MTTNMARLRGRAPKGEHLRAAIPHGHWKTTTFIGALRLSRLTAPMVLDGAHQQRLVSSPACTRATSGRVHPRAFDGLP